MKSTFYITIFLISVFSLSFDTEKCHISGVYKVVYEKPAQNLLITKIEFHDSIYYRTFELGKVKGTISKLIDRNGKCVFYLKDTPEVKVDPIKVSQVDISNNIIMKLKTMGEPIMEISEPIADTIDFKILYSGQLHVTINKGKLIKQ